MLTFARRAGLHALRERAELQRVLARSRPVLILAYLLFLTALGAAMSHAGLFGWPEAIGRMFGLPISSEFSFATTPVSGWGTAIGVFLVAQAILLFRVRRVRIRGIHTRKRATWGPVAVASLCAALLSIGIVFSYLEITGATPLNLDEWDKATWQDDAVGTCLRVNFAIQGLFTEDRPWRSAELVGVAWAFWAFVLGLWVWRRRSVWSDRGMLGLLLAGTWLEFFVALTVDLSRRRVDGTECPCARFSALGVVIGLGLTAILVGPALVLLGSSPIARRVRSDTWIRRSLLGQSGRQRRMP